MTKIIIFKMQRAETKINFHQILGSIKYILFFLKKNYDDKIIFHFF